MGAAAGTGYCLLFNGVLGDRSAAGGNVLTHSLLGALPPHEGPRVIYGERSAIGPAISKALGIEFKHVPYDIKGRRRQGGVLGQANYRMKVEYAPYHPRCGN